LPYLRLRGLTVRMYFPPSLPNQRVL